MKKSTLLICWAFLMPFFILAQTHVWTGNGGNEDWFDISNWNVNTIPDSNSSVQIPTNSTVRIDASNALANSIDILGSSTLHLSSQLTMGSVIQISPNSELIFDEGTLTGGTVDNEGLLQLESLALKTLSNVVINNNSEFLVSNSNQIQLMNVEINNSVGSEINIASVGGFLSQGGSPSVLHNEGLLSKVPDGINPIGNFYLILDVNNHGIIDIAQDEAFLCLGGNITLQNMETGIIRGNGTFDITADFINTGTIAPGGEATVGTLHITNNFNLSPPGALLIDIGNNVSEFDSIEVVGNPFLDGDIFVECQFTPTPGDEFTIITATNGIANCNFPQFVYADLFASSYEFEVICGPDTVILRYVREIILNSDEFVSNNELLIHPNPATEETQLTFPSNLLAQYERLEIMIYSGIGRLLNSFIVSSETSIIETNHLSSGIYLVQLVADGHVIGTKKLMKL